MPLSRIQLTFLVDNNPSDRCAAEHGLSIWIEADRKLLFDTGQSRLFLDNAAELGIDLDEASTIILSHGHYDHGNGLEYLSNKELICHSGCFKKRYRAFPNGYIGLKLTRSEASSAFALKLADEPVKLSETITFLGGIPKFNEFERQTTSFADENGQPDFVVDDSALAIETTAGLIIISGCAHAGICNIIEYARQVTGQTDVVAVLGGFHLKEGSQTIEPTIAYLKALKDAVFLPCHCVDPTVMATLHQQLNCEEVYSGRSISFPA